MEQLIHALRTLAGLIAGFWARGLVDKARSAGLAAKAHKAVADAGDDSPTERLYRLDSKGRLRRVSSDKRY